MGLDMVELVMAVEDEFEVALKDEDWFSIRTVADLHNAIRCQINSQVVAASLTCPSFAPFFATRDSLIALTGFDRRAIRPGTPLAELVAPADRSGFCRDVQRMTAIHLPALEYSFRGATTIFVASALAAVAGTFWATHILMSWQIPTACLTAASCGWGTFRLWHRRAAIHFPADCQTVGDIVRRARPPAYPAARQHLVPPPEDTWRQLVRIVSHQLDVPEDEVTQQTRFIEDLRCD